MVKRPWLVAVCAVVVVATACSALQACGAERVRAHNQPGSPAPGVTGSPAAVVTGDGLLALSGGNPDVHAVYTVHPDGSGLRRLPLPAVLLGPDAMAWSPDGKRLAFAAANISAHEDSNLYVVQASGRGLHQLTNALLGVTDVTWSPDGQWIAFAGFAHYVPAAFIIRADGTGLRPILPQFRVTSLAWGPSGRLAIAGTTLPAPPSCCPEQGIWTVNINGSDLKRLAGPIPLPSAVGQLLAVHGWSPDGRNLLIQSAPRYGDISIISATGGPPRVILHCPFQTCTLIPPEGMGAPPAFKNIIGSLAWSPDGRTIVFTVGGGVHWRVYTVSAHGSGLRLLPIRGGPSNIVAISWQPVASVPGGTRQSPATG